jgi:hypothetical protein
VGWVGSLSVDWKDLLNKVFHGVKESKKPACKIIPPQQSKFHLYS